MSDCQNCPHVSRISKTETQIDHIGALFIKMDLKLDQVIVALARVEILEVKHGTHTDALGRAFERIEIIERQSSETAKSLADLLSQIKGMTRAAVVAWTIMGAVVSYVATKVLS